MGGTTWRDTLNTSIEYAHRAGVSAREVIGPILNEQCRQEAVNCINNRINDPEQCPGWMKCNQARINIAVSLVALQHAVMDARLAIAIGDEASAEGAAAKALELASKIKSQLAEMGLL